MLPFVEQRAAFDGVNFDLGSFVGANITLAGLRPSTLVCPSDAAAAVLPADAASYPGSPPGPWTQAYTSYGGVVGAWNLMLHLSDSTFAQRQANHNGLIHAHGSVRLAEVTDGLSATMLLGEHVHGVLSPADQSRFHRWNSGLWLDAQVAAYYPPNAHKKILRLDDPTGRDYIAKNPASYHPGGVNMAFGDGSVRFIKDTIDSWTVEPSTYLARGVLFNSDGTRTIKVTSEARLGVWQALATRNFGEVIGAGDH